MPTPPLDPPLRVLALSGSFRRGSLNNSLLEAAQELAPEGVDIALYDYAEVPLYNADIDAEELRPEAVEQLKAAIDGANALLISTPEYNHGVPGVLKNAIDWVSRPAFHSPLAGKPVAMMGASTGSGGTAMAQAHLRTVLAATLAEVMPHRGVLVGRAGEKFDGDRRLTDERTRATVEAFLSDFAKWTRRRTSAVPMEAA